MSVYGSCPWPNVRMQPTGSGYALLGGSSATVGCSRRAKLRQVAESERVNAMVTVGIIGDFNPDSETRRATTEALQHAARALAIPVTVSWVSTVELSHGAVENGLTAFDALWAAPGSPYANMDGALRGIRFAREQGWPFVGT
jgi:CTP synthase (UTP-ammonia lyase)